MSDDDDLDQRSARALLICTTAIAHAGDDVEAGREAVAKLAQLEGTNEHAVYTQLQKLLKDLSYFRGAGASAKWKDKTYKMLNGAYSMLCQPVNKRVKDQVRGKFKCQLCGAIEENCNYVVHLAGTPTVDRGQFCDDYSAKAFVNAGGYADLAAAYDDYANAYNSAGWTSSSEALFPSPSYLGAILPGETCLQRLFAAFGAQDLVRQVIDESFETKAPVDEPLSRTRVANVAAKLAHVRGTAGGFLNPLDPPEDHEFWNELLSNFITTKKIHPNDHRSRIQAGYDRMEDSVSGSGWIVPVPTRGNSSKGDASKPATRSNKKSKVAELDNESDDLGKFIEHDTDDEDEGPIYRPINSNTYENPANRPPGQYAVVGGAFAPINRLDDDEDVYENPANRHRGYYAVVGGASAPINRLDDDEDVVVEDLATKPKDKWGSTEASKKGPFATPRRQTMGAPTAGLRRKRNAVVLSDDDDVEDEVVEASKTADKQTARRLRQPSVKAIGSRRSTLEKLSNVGYLILTNGHLSGAVTVFKALTTLTQTLDEHERGVSVSDSLKLDRIREVELQLKNTKTLVAANCDASDVRDVAEALVVAYELLL